MVFFHVVVVSCDLHFFGVMKRCGLDFSCEGEYYYGECWCLVVVREKIGGLLSCLVLM